jgi:type IV secretory pathway component VirB8
MPLDSEEQLLEADERVPALREPIFHDVLSAHRAEMRFNDERSRAGWWVGGIGAGLAVILAITTAAIAIGHQPQVRYTVINAEDGIIRESVGPKDAPQYYSEQVIRHALKDYNDHRQRFVWQLDPETYHHVAMLSSPDEQLRYDEERQKQKPGERYGTMGYSKVIRYPGVDADFRRRAKGKDGTLEYEFQFVKGEVLAANPTIPVETKWTVRMIFQFHPELKMKDQDRLDNESGLRVIFYNAIED